MSSNCLNIINRVTRAYDKDHGKGTFDELDISEQMKYANDGVDSSKVKERNSMVQAIKVNELQTKIVSYADEMKERVDKMWGITKKVTSAPTTEAGRLEAARRAVLATDRWEMYQGVSVEGRVRALVSKSQSEVFDMMEELQPTMLGLKNNTDSENLLLDLIIDGEINAKTKLTPEQKLKVSKFKKMAKDWGDLRTALLNRRNAAGGDTKLLKTWALPTHHDSNLIGKGGKSFKGDLTPEVALANWTKLIRETVDFEAMNVPAKKIDAAIKGAFDNMRTDGTVEFDFGEFMGAKSLSNRRQESRFFKFKDAEAYKKYHAEYSDSSAYDLMMDYVSEMSSEIALMEQLGPNPDLTVASLGVAEGDRSNNIYRNLSGKISAVDIKLSDAGDMIRNATTGVSLGGAMISALSDPIYHGLTNIYNGAPAFKSLTKTIDELASNIGNTPAGRANRKLAAQMWVPMDHMIDSAHNAARYADVVGHKNSKKFAGAILKGTGLDSFTYAQKMAFHEEMLGALANNIDGMPQFLKRYGFSAEDIAAIKKSKKIDNNGATFVDPNTLDVDLAERITGAIISETRYAVTEGDMYTRAVMNQGSSKGTIPGELMRAGTQFKTFPASIIMNHWTRVLRGHGELSRSSYLASMIVGTTILGTVSTQLKEIAAGREPIAWDNPELWTKGFVQGGATSFYGDLLMGEGRSYGQSMQEYVMGPSAGLILNDILWEGIGGSLDDLSDPDKDFQKNLRMKVTKGVANKITMNVWYAKAAAERLILEDIRRWGDPDFDKKERIKEKKRYEKYGNERLF